MKKGKLGYFIIGSALIWGFAIVGVAFMLKGFPNKERILSILSTSAGIHLILIWGPLAAVLNKDRKKQE